MKIDMQYPENFDEINFNIKEQYSRKRQRSNMNMSFPLSPLESKVDGGIFYLSNRFPKFSLDFNEGYVFFVFLSEEGMEEIQIGRLDQETTKFSRYEVIQKDGVDKVKFKIYPKTDVDGKTYFVGTLKFPAEMTFNTDDGSIMVFTSVPGSEAVQLQGTLVHINK